MFVEFIQPPGSLIEGHLFDVDKVEFEKALKAYDSSLYVYWNSKKLKGAGCWEIRRKSRIYVTDQEEIGQRNYLIANEHYDPQVDHVLDVCFLNYDQIRKIREMDVAHIADYAAHVEKLEREYKEKAKERGQAAIKDVVSQFGREISQLQAALRDGLNPAEIARYWNTVGELE